MKKSPSTSPSEKVKQKHSSTPSPRKHFDDDARNLPPQHVKKFHNASVNVTTINRPSGLSLIGDGAGSYGHPLPQSIQYKINEDGKLIRKNQHMGVTISISPTKHTLTVSSSKPAAKLSPSKSYQSILPASTLQNMRLEAEKLSKSNSGSHSSKSLKKRPQISAGVVLGVDIRGGCLNENGSSKLSTISPSSTSKSSFTGVVSSKSRSQGSSKSNVAKIQGRPKHSLPNSSSISPKTCVVTPITKSVQVNPITASTKAVGTIPISKLSATHVSPASQLFSSTTTFKPNAHSSAKVTPIARPGLLKVRKVSSDTKSSIGGGTGEKGPSLPKKAPKLGGKVPSVVHSGKLLSPTSTKPKLKLPSKFASGTDVVKTHNMSAMNSGLAKVPVGGKGLPTPKQPSTPMTTKPKIISKSGAVLPKSLTLATSNAKICLKSQTSPSKEMKSGKKLKSAKVKTSLQDITTELVNGKQPSLKPKIKFPKANGKVPSVHPIDPAVKVKRKLDDAKNVYNDGSTTKNSVKPVQNSKIIPSGKLKSKKPHLKGLKPATKVKSTKLPGTVKVVPKPKPKPVPIKRKIILLRDKRYYASVMKRAIKLKNNADRKRHLRKKKLIQKARTWAKAQARTKLIRRAIKPLRLRLMHAHLRSRYKAKVTKKDASREKMLLANLVRSKDATTKKNVESNSNLVPDITSIDEALANARRRPALRIPDLKKRLQRHNKMLSLKSEQSGKNTSKHFKLFNIVATHHPRRILQNLRKTRPANLSINRVKLIKRKYARIMRHAKHHLKRPKLVRKLYKAQLKKSKKVKLLIKRKKQTVSRTKSASGLKLATKQNEPAVQRKKPPPVKGKPHSSKLPLTKTKCKNKHKELKTHNNRPKKQTITKTTSHKDLKEGKVASKPGEKIRSKSAGKVKVIPLKSGHAPNKAANLICKKKDDKMIKNEKAQSALMPPPKSRAPRAVKLHLKDAVRRKIDINRKRKTSVDKHSSTTALNARKKTASPPRKKRKLDVNVKRPSSSKNIGAKKVTQHVVGRAKTTKSVNTTKGGHNQCKTSQKKTQPAATDKEKQRGKSMVSKIRTAVSASKARPKTAKTKVARVTPCKTHQLHRNKSKVKSKATKFVTQNQLRSILAVHAVTRGIKIIKPKNDSQNQTLELHSKARRRETPARLQMLKMDDIQSPDKDLLIHLLKFQRAFRGEIDSHKMMQLNTFVTRHELAMRKNPLLTTESTGCRRTESEMKDARQDFFIEYRVPPADNLEKVLEMSDHDLKQLEELRNVLRPVINEPTQKLAILSSNSSPLDALALTLDGLIGAGLRYRKQCDSHLTNAIIQPEPELVLPPISEPGPIEELLHLKKPVDYSGPLTLRSMGEVINKRLNHAAPTKEDVKVLVHDLGLHFCSSKPKNIDNIRKRALAQGARVPTSGKKRKDPTDKSKALPNKKHGRERKRKRNNVRVISKSEPRHSRRLHTLFPRLPIMEHCIDLWKHLKEIQVSRRIFKTNVYHPPGPLPKFPSTAVIQRRLRRTYIPLSGPQVDYILSLSTSTLAAFVGYEEIRQGTMECMVGLMRNFYTRIAHNLKQVTEREMVGAPYGFQDPVERVLFDMGFGGIDGLFNSSRANVIEYRNELVEECLQQRQALGNKLRSKMSLQAAINSVIKPRQGGRIVKNKTRGTLGTLPNNVKKVQKHNSSVNTKDKDPKRQSHTDVLKGKQKLKKKKFNPTLVNPGGDKLVQKQCTTPVKKSPSKMDIAKMGFVSGKSEVREEISFGTASAAHKSDTSKTMGQAKENKDKNKIKRLSNSDTSKVAQNPKKVKAKTMSVVSNLSSQQPGTSKHKTNSLTSHVQRLSIVKAHNKEAAKLKRFKRDSSVIDPLSSILKGSPSKRGKLSSKAEKRITFDVVRRDPDIHIPKKVHSVNTAGAGNVSFNPISPIKTGQWDLERSNLLRLNFVEEEQPSELNDIVILSSGPAS